MWAGGGGRGSGIVFQRSRLNLTCPVLGAWAVRLISPKRLLWVSLGEKALLGVHAPANMSYLLFRAWCISAQPTVLGSRGGVSPDFGQLPSQSLSYLHGLRPMRGLCRMRAAPGSTSYLVASAHPQPTTQTLERPRAVSGSRAGQRAVCPLIGPWVGSGGSEGGAHKGVTTNSLVRK